MSYAIKSFAIDGASWYPIAAPIECTGWSLRGSADFHVRTDANDAATEDDVPVGTTESVDPSSGSHAYTRWFVGDVVIYAKSQAGAQTLIGRFLLAWWLLVSLAAVGSAQTPRPTPTTPQHVICDSGCSGGGGGGGAVTVADGADVTLGAKADNRSTATDTTAVSAISILKQLSFMAQAPAALPANQSVNVNQIVGAAPSATNFLPFRLTDGSAYITPSTDYTHNTALTVATTAGPMGIARASAAAPTDVGADNNAVVLWALRSGALVMQLSAGGALIPGDATNGLKVNCTTGCSGGGGLSVVDKATFTASSSSFTPSGGEYNPTAALLTSGQQGTLALTASRAALVAPADSSGVDATNTTEHAVNVHLTNAGAIPVALATPVASYSVDALGAYRDDRQIRSLTTTDQPQVTGAVTTSAPTYVDGTARALSLTATGDLRVAAASLPLPALAATSTLQTSGAQKTQIVDGSGNVISSTSNNLNVQCANCSGSGASATDQASFTAGTSVFAPSGGEYNPTATRLTAGQQGMVALTSSRALQTTLYTSAGVESGTATNPQIVGFATPPKVSFNGAQPVQLVDRVGGMIDPRITRTLTSTDTVSISGTVPINNSQLNGVAYATGIGPSGTSGAVQRVALSSDSYVNLANLPDLIKALQNVRINNSALNGGAIPVTLNSGYTPSAPLYVAMVAPPAGAQQAAYTPIAYTGQTTTVQTTKAGPAVLAGYYISNTANAASSCVQFFDSTSAVLGTTTPKMVLELPANGAANIPPDGPGIGFATGLQIAVATTCTGNTAPSSGLNLTLWYR
jgi:hypothetical protein